MHKMAAGLKIRRSHDLPRELALQRLSCLSPPCDTVSMSRPDKLAGISWAVAVLFIVLWIAYIVTLGEQC